MNAYVQALESRTLLSGTVSAAALADVAALKAEAAAFKAAFPQAVPTIVADIHALNVDVHGLPNSGANRALVAKLRADEMHAIGKLKADAGAMFNLAVNRAAHVVNAAMHVALHPSLSSVLSLLSTTVVTGLQAAETAVTLRFANDTQAVGAAVSADMGALTAANPTNAALQADVTKMQNDFATIFQNLQSHFQSYESNFQTLAADLSATA